MKLSNHILALLILWAVSVNAQVTYEIDILDEIQTWPYLGTARDKSETYYVKIEKTNQFNSEVSIWLKVVLSDKKTKLRNGKYKVEKRGYYLQHMVFNCEDRTFDSSDYINYDDDSKIISSTKLGIYNKRVVPDTLGEQIYDFVCVTKEE